MKILLTTLLCLSLCLPALADQQTTVLSQQTAVGKATATLPYIDGSNEVELEKQANAIVRETAAKLVKEVGGQGTLTYKMMLNRPSLVSLLLEADNGDRTAYKGLNLDLTTGKEFTVTDFFVDNDNVKAALGDYENVLFGDAGFYIRSGKNAAYSTFVPYSDLLSSLRIGDAGRLLQLARLTENAAGKTLHLPQSGLIALKLDSNPSTGYGWTMSCSSPAVSKVGSSFTIPRSDENRVGVPGVEILVLAVTKPGTYNVRMDYKRSWEKISLNSFSFTVVAE